MPTGASVIENAIDSSAVINGWIDYGPNLLMSVGIEAFSSAVCGLWTKKASSAVADFPERERVVLAVDRGAWTALVTSPNVHPQKTVPSPAL